MNIESFREYCLAKKGVTEHFPFDEVTLVFKVMNKMFALTRITIFESINLKCDPEKAVLLRENYSGIIPGYHMSKVHWNTVSTDGSVPDKLLIDLIDESYGLVVSKLTKKEKAELSLL
ncbi:MAG: MmcQ/YjbR family DNA-binding protein [Vicingaceae bacterium]